MIPGMKYIPNFISQEDESIIISLIDKQPWLNNLKRRTQHYGYRYDYAKKRIDSSMFLGPIPEWLNKYSTKLLAFFKEIPDQIIINEYFPGQGISPHIDCIPCFKDTIASLSLNSACKMNFDGYEERSIYLEPRSLLVLTDEARYNWKHSIAPLKEDLIDNKVIPRGRRISLTFRNVIK